MRQSQLEVLTVGAGILPALAADWLFDADGEAVRVGAAMIGVAVNLLLCGRVDDPEVVRPLPDDTVWICRTAALLSLPLAGVFGLHGLAGTFLIWAAMHWFADLRNIAPSWIKRWRGELPWSASRWLGLVVDTCKSVSNGETTANDFSSLRSNVEQELEVDQMLRAFRGEIDTSQTEPIQRFLQAVRACQRQIERTPGFDISDSNEWRRVRATATDVLRPRRVRRSTGPTRKSVEPVRSRRRDR